MKMKIKQQCSDRMGNQEVKMQNGERKLEQYRNIITEVKTTKPKPESHIERKR